MKRILVATDGSEGAARALASASELALQGGGRLWIVNVINQFGFSRAELDQFRQAEGGSFSDLLESLSAQWLRDAGQEARRRGVQEVQLLSRSGDIAATIAAAADECSADVIVIGRRGRGLMSGLLLGSVSQKLASSASRPVLVVP